MRRKIVEETEIDERLDVSIKEGLCTCFPADREIDSKTRAWHGYYPSWSVVVLKRSTVIAHAAVIDRKILTEKKEIHIAGIMNVFVLPRHLGRDFQVS